MSDDFGPSHDHSRRMSHSPAWTKNKPDTILELVVPEAGNIHSGVGKRRSYRLRRFGGTSNLGSSTNRKPPIGDQPTVLPSLMPPRPALGGGQGGRWRP